METLASQYYAQIGIGGMARPMVVGDRLWLFSQTPNGPAPMQSMMLNGPSATPTAIPPTLRGFNTPPPPNSPILDSARAALLSRGQPLNYGLSKSLSPYQSAPFHHNHLTSQPVKNYDTAFMSPKAQMKMSMPSSYFPFSHRTDASFSNMKYMQDKFTSELLHSSGVNDAHISEQNVTPPPSTGITELERAFGGDRNIMLMDPPVVGGGKSVHCKKLLKEEPWQRNGKEDFNLDESTSDIDCEEIDENDV